MRVEVCLLRECCSVAEGLQKRIAALYGAAVTAHGGWEQLLEELANFDFAPLNDHWLQAEFRYVSEVCSNSKNGPLCFIRKWMIMCA